MKKKFYILISVLLITLIKFQIIFSNGAIRCARPYNRRTSNDPYCMVGNLQAKIINFHWKYKNFPKEWAEIPTKEYLRTPEFKEEIQPGYLVIPYSDTIKVVTKKFFKDEWFTYTIVKADKNDFLVVSNNNAGLQNWAADRNDVWKYFYNEKEELEIVDKWSKVLLSSNNLKEIEEARFQLSDLSHPRLFRNYLNALEIAYKENKSREIIDDLLYGIKSIPNLYRFKDDLNKIYLFYSMEKDKEKKNKNLRSINRTYRSIMYAYEKLITKLKKDY